MKQFYVALLFLFASGSLFPQVFLCHDGNTRFTSEAPLELIKASSDKTSGALDTKTKNVAWSVDVDTFEGFNSALQKEHFQENYMETEKYRNATFKGKIIEDVDLTKPGTYTVRAKGTFNIHGTEKEKIVKVQITVSNKQVTVESKFEVPLEDHNIKIPKVVNQKIASVIMVEVKASLKPKA